MKKLTCRDLGGPCDQEFSGVSFEEIGRNCRAHVMELVKNGDAAHSEAAMKMRNASPEEQMAMMAAYKKRFDDAPDA
jgi:Protein of unknown function (DUF1059)